MHSTTYGGVRDDLEILQCPEKMDSGFEHIEEEHVCEVILSKAKKWCICVPVIGG